MQQLEQPPGTDASHTAARSGLRVSIGPLAADHPGVLIASIVAVEAIVVLWVLGLGHHAILGADGPSYERYAQNLVDHLKFSDATGPPLYPSVLRTPGYPAFLALLRLLAGDSVLVVRIAQFALLAATAILVQRVGRTLLGARVGLVAGVLCATSLPLIWLANYHLTESASAFLLVAVVWILIRAGTGGLWDHAAVGALMAILALVRPEFAAAVAPIAAGVLLWHRAGGRTDRLLRPAVLLAAFVAVMAPWTVRNAIVAHRFVPLGTGSGPSLYVSAEQYAGRISYQLTPSEYAALYGPNGTFRRITRAADRRVAATRGSIAQGTRRELAENDAIMAAARRAFRALSVGQVARSLPKRVAYLWGTADYPPLGASYTTAAHRLAQVQWALLVVLIVLGAVVAVSRLRARTWPLFLFPVYVTLEHLVFHAQGRYSVSPRPILMLFAALGVAWLVERRRRVGQTAVA
jgi:4-amino-4-deoxy-L-arabinose transferase-like glycosyltransferase